MTCPYPTGFALDATDVLAFCANTDVEETCGWGMRVKLDFPQTSEVPYIESDQVERLHRLHHGG